MQRRYTDAHEAPPSDGSQGPVNVRIPAALLGKMDGVRLEIPCGEDITVKRLKASDTHVRFSLRTNDPVEAMMRKAQAVAYLEAVFATRSQDAPVFSAIVSA